MFSRLLTAQRLPTRSILAAIPLHSKNNLNLNQSVYAIRLFHSNKSLLNTAVATPPTAVTSTTTTDSTATNQPITVRSIIDKYGGWYPLAGLTSIILLSKEIFVLNEEGYQLFMTGFWLVFVGVFAADYLRGPMEQLVKEDDQMLHDEGMLIIEGIQNNIEDNKTAIKLAKDMHLYLDEYYGALKKASIAADKRNRLIAREATIQKLQSLKQRQLAEKQRAASALLDEALQYVRSEVKNLSKEEKDAIINYSIRAISGDVKSMPKSEDPILRLFTKFLESKVTA